MENGYENFNNQQSSNVPVENEFTKWLISGILQFLCCNQITAVITIVLACMANSDFKAGLIDSAVQKYKHCKTATIIGVVLGLVLTLFVMLIYGIGFASILASA